MHSLINKIQSKIKSNILLDYNMSKSTWFRTGGNALGYVIINNMSDLKTIISYAEQIKYYIVGLGSNLLVRDERTFKKRYVWVHSEVRLIFISKLNEKVSFGKCVSMSVKLYYDKKMKYNHSF